MHASPRVRTSHLGSNRRRLPMFMFLQARADIPVFDVPARLSRVTIGRVGRGLLLLRQVQCVPALVFRLLG